MKEVRDLKDLTIHDAHPKSSRAEDENWKSEMVSGSKPVLQGVPHS